MKSKFTNQDGASIILDMIETIYTNKQYLSDIDGLIGDGDHGINMNKGFQLCKNKLESEPGNLAYSAGVLSKILMMKIGGSMGPLYGKLFSGFSKALADEQEIGKEQMQVALNAMLTSIQTISLAKLGDKTLIDTLCPAISAYNKAIDEHKDFVESLDAMKIAAQVGRDSTKNMVAQLGRASRLGERSRGVLDAGATSCCLLLETLVDRCKILLS